MMTIIIVTIIIRTKEVEQTTIVHEINDQEIMTMNRGGGGGAR